ncbi:hypothetical protein B0H11DRAFT_2190049 [Mycena galericulata]|nr:hypothetical protein B0H11DRAFT_2190049 [Mycena galericulata]
MRRAVRTVRLVRNKQARGATSGVTRGRRDGRRGEREGGVMSGEGGAVSGAREVGAGATSGQRRRLLRWAACEKGRRKQADRGRASNRGGGAGGQDDAKGGRLAGCKGNQRASASTFGGRDLLQKDPREFRACLRTSLRRRAYKSNVVRRNERVERGRIQRTGKRRKSEEIRGNAN